MKPLRSQPTRDRILEAARKVFGREGYERATIRTVAAEAGIHPSMVIRYYHTKEQLFATAAHIDLQLPDLGEADRTAIGRRLAAHFLQRWEGPGADGQLQALLRASVSHEDARAKLNSIFDTQVLGAISRVVRDRAAERAALIASLILGLAFGRYVLKVPALVALDAEALVKAAGGAIQSYLD